MIRFAGIALTALLMAGALDSAVAKSSSTKHYSRSQFTEAQRARILENARKVCKKRYGAGASVYRIDYYKGTIWCLEG